MATPSYPQEDNQEKTSLPCCKTLSLEGRWRNQISATLQGSTLGSLDHPAMPTGGGCNLHCDIVTWYTWIFATAKRWSKKKKQCKFPLYETDDVEIDILFLGDMESLVHWSDSTTDHPWASGCWCHCPSHRERAASKEFRSISIPGRVTSEALPTCHGFHTNCSDFKTSEVWYVSKGKNTTRSWSVGSSNWVPPDPTSQKISWASCSPKVSVKRKQCWQSFVKPRCFMGDFCDSRKPFFPRKWSKTDLHTKHTTKLLSNI